MGAPTMNYQITSVHLRTYPKRTLIPQYAKSAFPHICVRSIDFVPSSRSRIPGKTRRL